METKKTMKILTTSERTEERVLRKPARRFDFSRRSKKELKELLQTMRKTMQAANGIGLSANQVGIDESFFIARVENKFYAVFNPKIVKVAGAAELEEGCLSVPETYGVVNRAEWVILTGEDQSGKKIKIKAWGLLAQVFQHEADHLNGVLFIDKCKKVYAVQKFEIRNPKHETN